MQEMSGRQACLNNGVTQFNFINVHAHFYRRMDIVLYSIFKLCVKSYFSNKVLDKSLVSGNNIYIEPFYFFVILAFYFCRLCVVECYPLHF